MIAAPIVALAALYVDMQCVRCVLYRHDRVRWMSPLGKRTFTGRGR
jgi:hypothetical protein